jgi:hypothetical protein
MMDMLVFVLLFCWGCVLQFCCGMIMSAYNVDLEGVLECADLSFQESPLLPVSASITRPHRVCQFRPFAFDSILWPMNCFFVFMDSSVENE